MAQRTFDARPDGVILDVGFRCPCKIGPRRDRGFESVSDWLLRPMAPGRSRRRGERRFNLTGNRIRRSNVAGMGRALLTVVLCILAPPANVGEVAFGVIAHPQVVLVADALSILGD